MPEQKKGKRRAFDACYKLARNEPNLIKKMEISFFGSLASSNATSILRRLADLEGCFPADHEVATGIRDDRIAGNGRSLDPALAEQRERLMEDLIGEMRNAIRKRDPRFFEECAQSLSAIGLNSKPKAPNAWAVLQAILMVARMKGPGKMIRSTEVFNVLFPEAYLPVASLRKKIAGGNSDSVTNPYGLWGVTFWTADSVRSEVNRVGLGRFPISTDRVLSDFQAYLAERSAGR